MIPHITTQISDFEGEIDDTSAFCHSLKEFKASSKSDQPKADLGSSQRNSKNSTELVFKDLTYEITKEYKPCSKSPLKSSKIILENLSGVCKPGELTAIMGTSGAGKTSLLNILSCRILNTDPNVKLSGTILANGNQYDHKKFKNFASYLTQDDFLLPTLTIRETFKFVANLRIVGTKEYRDQKVDEMLDTLMLNKAADTKVGGGIISGISGGERKRTSIGIELFTNPGVLFLDEPTSGLDSSTALILITFLKRLVEQGKTIIVTIHQPNSDIFWQFDQLMLLSRGKFVYQGPLAEVVKYFGNLGHECPEYSNPADFLLALIYENDNEDLLEAYQRHIQPRVINEVNRTEKKALPHDIKEIGWINSLRTLSWRAKINYLRNPMLLKARAMNSIVMLFVLLSLFWKLNDDPTNPVSLNDRRGALYFNIFSIFIGGMLPVMTTFTVERDVVVKEHNSKMYGVLPYFLGRQIYEIPFIVVFPIIVSAIVYYPLNYNRDGVERFFIFILIMKGVALAGNAVGLLVCSGFSGVETLNGFVPMIIVPFILFGGLGINLATISKVVRWIQWLSPFRYAYEGLLRNEFENSAFGDVAFLEFDFRLGLWNAILLLYVYGLLLRLFSILVLKFFLRRIR